MVPVVNIVGPACEFGSQHGQVAPVLVLLRSVIADMLEQEIRLADLETGLLGQAQDVDGDLLVNGAPEADAGIVAEQAVLPA